jgi:hypothetical protein
MSRVPETAAALLGAALLLLLPSLVATDSPALVAVAVVAMALTAMVASGATLGVLAAGIATPAFTTRRAAPALLPGRATDPVHHPIRPRAPGTA